MSTEKTKKDRIAEEIRKKNAKICSYKDNEQVKTFHSLSEAIEWAVARAEGMCAIKLTIGGETYISCVEGFVQKTPDKEDRQ